MTTVPTHRLQSRARSQAWRGVLALAAMLISMPVMVTSQPADLANIDMLQDAIAKVKSLIDSSGRDTDASLSLHSVLDALQSQLKALPAAAGNDSAPPARQLAAAPAAPEVQLAATRRRAQLILSPQYSGVIQPVTCASHPELCDETYTRCDHLNGCSGHGRCDPATRSCACDAGWGAPTDAMAVRSPDCSIRACPSGRAWADIAVAPNVAHQPAECSRAGRCERATGVCACFPGFTGAACEYKACPNDCSARGECVALSQLHRYTNAAPFGPAGPTYSATKGTSYWDADKIQACVCDSAWPVGYGEGDTQAIEFFEPDCSKRNCASGDDPWTSTVDETDCFLFDENRAIWRGPVYLATGKPALIAQTAADLAAAKSTYDWAGNGTDTNSDGIVWYQSALPDTSAVGLKGNKCHIECSRRGSCNYSTGTCNCFDGYGGPACHLRKSIAST